MKLMVLSATHNVGGARGPVYEFFLRRMEHIRQKYGIEMLVVGNEGELTRSMTEGYGSHYLEYSNKPVSNKWNAGMVALRGHNPTHVMIMGSDDLISDGFVDKYLDIISEGKYNVMGITDSYYCSYNTGRAYFSMCLYWAGYTKRPIIGYGRCFASEILDAVDWQPWPQGKNYGLDFAASIKIRDSKVPQSSYKFSIKEEGCFHIDIKTRGNISSLAPLVRRSTELNLDIDALLYKYLPSDEVVEILSYLEVLKSQYVVK